MPIDLLSPLLMIFTGIGFGNCICRLNHPKPLFHSHCYKGNFAPHTAHTLKTDNCRDTNSVANVGGVCCHYDNFCYVTHNKANKKTVWILYGVCSVCEINNELIWKRWRPTTQIASTLGSTSIRHRSDAKASDRCLFDIDSRAFAIWVEAYK